MRINRRRMLATLLPSERKERILIFGAEVEFVGGLEFNPYYWFDTWFFPTDSAALLCVALSGLTLTARLLLDQPLAAEPVGQQVGPFYDGEFFLSHAEAVPPSLEYVQLSGHIMVDQRTIKSQGVFHRYGTVIAGVNDKRWWRLDGDLQVA